MWQNLQTLIKEENANYRIQLRSTYLNIADAQWTRFLAGEFMRQEDTVSSTIGRGEHYTITQIHSGGVNVANTVWGRGENGASWGCRPAFF